MSLLAEVSNSKGMSTICSQAAEAFRFDLVVVAAAKAGIMLVTMMLVNLNHSTSSCLARSSATGR